MARYFGISVFKLRLSVIYRCSKCVIVRSCTFFNLLEFLCMFCKVRRLLPRKRARWAHFYQACWLVQDLAYKNLGFYFSSALPLFSPPPTPNKHFATYLVAAPFMTHVLPNKMSSLAKQLKQLQIPGHHGATTAAKSGKKVSLLFDAKEASDIDNETIYSLGINGLVELKSIDTSFAPFESTLFNQSSKTLERTLQTQGVNENIDKEISKFLRCLSPYVLLKPAHKTLEWLVRRFQIHVFNVSELLRCVLPYHETKLFVRIVQLLTIADPSSKWNWLHPLQKSGAPLPRLTLLQRCITDPSFFFLVCDLANQVVESGIPASSSRTLLTFYTSTVVGCLETMKRISEEFLTRLVPHVLRGLKSEIPDLKAGSYMIVAQLCVKCSLEKTLVKSLIESICKVRLTQRNQTWGGRVGGFLCLFTWFGLQNWLWGIVPGFQIRKGFLFSLPLK